jgi:hypothetical protein
MKPLSEKETMGENELRQIFQIKTSTNPLKLNKKSQPSSNI